MVINRLTDGRLASIFAMQKLEMTLTHALCGPTLLPPVSSTMSGIPPFHSLLEELEVTAMTISLACEGSVHAEDGHPLPSLADITVGWVRHIPLSTLVAYREKVS
jgi:hypothetical protein